MSEPSATACADASSSTTAVDRIVVVVPAHDEADRIGACLDAVRDAVAVLRRDRPGIDATVVVVADGCRDATAAVATERGAVVLETPHVGVGAARALGIEAGLAGAGSEPARVWIANTDADSLVPPQWLSEQAAEAEGGADAVIGTVHPDARDLPPLSYAHWLSTRVPGRPNGLVHGANLGLRADVYLAAGGFGADRLHEDVRLMDRVRSLGARVVASDRGDVLTSGRRENRVDGGYAGYLHGELRRAAGGHAV